MNRREAANVLAVILAPYTTGEPLDELAVEAWYQAALEACSVEEGRETAGLVIKSEQYRPTPAVFNGYLAAVRRRRDIAGEIEATQERLRPRGLPGGVSEDDDRARARTFIEEAVATVARRRALGPDTDRRHDG